MDKTFKANATKNIWQDSNKNLTTNTYFYSTTCIYRYALGKNYVYKLKKAWFCIFLGTKHYTAKTIKVTLSIFVVKN